MNNNMTTEYNPPASIEAEKAKGKARKVILQGPQKNSVLSCTTYRFKFDRNCEVSIVEEVFPKTARIKPYSLLNKGDGIKGDMISGFSTKPLKKPKVGPGSSTHQASFISFRNFVFACLEKSWGSLENKKKTLLEGTSLNLVQFCPTTSLLPSYTQAH